MKVMLLRQTSASINRGSNIYVQLSDFIYVISLGTIQQSQYPRNAGEVLTRCLETPNTPVARIP
jgi:hypothetical protein